MTAAAVLALIFLGGYYAGRAPVRVVHAQSPSPQRVWTVPKSWGDLKGVYHDQLLFEDQHGTIRSVFPNSASVVFTIRRN
jgi:hypothetical protein